MNDLTPFTNYWDSTVPENERLVYCKGTLNAQGKDHGKVRFYSETKPQYVVEIAEYRNGMRHGMSVSYDDKGKVKEVVKFYKGNVMWMVYTNGSPDDPDKWIVRKPYFESTVGVFGDEKNKFMADNSVVDQVKQIVT